MAEALARIALRRRGLDRWEAASAGLAAFAGDEATALARAVVVRRGESLEAHRSRPLSPYAVEGARLVLTMTLAQREALRRLFPDHRRKILLLAEAAGDEGEIDDPFGGDVEVYEAVAARIEVLLDRLLEKMAGS